MPGLNVVYNLKGPLDDKGPVLDRALKACCVAEDYRAERLHDGSALVITAARYAEYPLRSFENDRFRVFLEGRIYGPVEERIERILLLVQPVSGLPHPPTRFLLRAGLGADVPVFLPGIGLELRGEDVDFVRLVVEVHLLQRVHHVHRVKRELAVYLARLIVDEHRHRADVLRFQTLRSRVRREVDRPPAVYGEGVPAGPQRQEGERAW